MKSLLLIGGIVVIAALFTVLPGYDFEANAQMQAEELDAFDLHSENVQPRGITFHDNKFWVIDSANKMVFAYESDGTPDEESGFSLQSENDSPLGITYLNNKFWVVDNQVRKVFAYTADGEYDVDSSFSLPMNDTYSGITFRDGQFWVVGFRTSTIYACNIDITNECTFETGSEIKLAPNNRLPVSVMFYSEKIWVTDILSETLFAYDLDGKYNEQSSLTFEQSSGLSFGLALHDSKVWIASAKQGTVKSFDPFTKLDLTVSYKLDLGNANPAGMTFYDDRFWLVDREQDRVFVYKFDDGSSTKIVHSLGDEFTFDVLHSNPIGIDYANDRLWIIEFNDGKIHAYDVNGTHYPDAAISLVSENVSPVGLAINNDKLWVIDQTHDSIFAYNFDGTHDEQSGFSLRPENRITTGITFYDEKIWVLDSVLNKILAYNIDGSIPDGLSEFTLHPENTNGISIAFQDGKFWVADSEQDEVFAYDTSGIRIPGYQFLLDNGNSNPTGIVFADNKFWLVEHDDRRIYDYTAEWEHDPFSEFILHEMNQFPDGITFDGNNLWVVDNRKESLFSYTLDGEFVDGPFELHRDNKRPTGITFDGDKLWVVDEHEDKLFAYNLNGEFNTTIEILADTDEPSGVVFAGDRFWVIDGGNNHVVAYDTSGIQDSLITFQLHEENTGPEGIEFVDGTFWVADKNGMVYSYVMDLNMGLLLSVNDPDFLEQGNETKIAADLAIMDFNKHLSEMDSIWRLNVDFRDTDLDPEKALEEVIELNAHNVDVIVGVPTSASVDMVKDYIDENDMVLVSCCSTAPQLAERDNVFRMVPPDSGQAPLLAKHIMDAEISDIIILYRDDSWGIGLKDVLVSSFEGLNGNILDVIKYNPNDSAHTDFDGIASMTSGIISEYDNPDGIGVVFLGWSETATMMEVAGTYPNLSDVVWFGSGDSAGESTLLEEPAVSFAMDTSFSVVQFVSRVNDTTEMVKAHVMGETNREPAVYAYSTYDAVWVAGLAMLAAQSNDGYEVLSQIHTVAAERTGAMGPNKLTPAGDLALSTYTVQAVRDGMWQDLGPISAASITGTIFSDVNKNGIRDAGEPGIEGYEMSAINFANPSEVITTTTNPDGMYELAVEPSATVLVQAGFFPPNHTVSNVSTSWYKYVTLQVGKTETFDIGFLPVSPDEQVTLNFVMYVDANQNGMMDANEDTVSGLDDFYVYTYTTGPVAYPVPDEMGRATVNDLVPSDFAVLAHVDLLADAGYVWVTTSYILHGDSDIEYNIVPPVIVAPEPGSEYTMMIGLAQ
ncbi:MAG: ABC transporter substrate-binding protein [Thaumarchaeota archaeon]|nr:ABC transporter substrate-binding protein [Nitrososphaerota archaeon]